MKYSLKTSSWVKRCGKPRGTMGCHRKLNLESSSWALSWVFWETNRGEEEYMKCIYRLQKIMTVLVRLWEPASGGAVVVSAIICRQSLAFFWFLLQETVPERAWRANLGQPWQILMPRGEYDTRIDSVSTNDIPGITRVVMAPATFSLLTM